MTVKVFNMAGSTPSITLNYTVKDVLTYKFNSTAKDVLTYKFNMLLNSIFPCIQQESRFSNLFSL
jgi:hypothetical protein